MSHHVPEFEMDEGYSSIPTSTSSTITGHKAEDEIMELVWQDGRIVSHPQKHPRNLPPITVAPPVQPQPESNAPLYIGEDEMATWLHYPIEDLYSDLLYQTPTQPPPPQSIATQSSTSIAAAPPLPPQRASRPPPVPPAPAPATTRNFPLFSRMSGRGLAEQPSSSKTELTVVDSNDTPITAAPVGPAAVSAFPARVGEFSGTLSRGSPAGRGGGGGGVGSVTRGGGSGDLTVTSSSSASASGGSRGTSGNAAAPVEGGDPGWKHEVATDRKRKSREIDETAATTATAVEEMMKLEREVTN